MMSEDEAKTKWCPFSRPVFPRADDCGYQAGNRQVDADRMLDLPWASMCIASRCMAWRWQPTHINNPDDPKADMIWSARTYGFCGLAGDSPPLPVGAPT